MNSEERKKKLNQIYNRQKKFIGGSSLSKEINTNYKLIKQPEFNINSNIINKDIKSIKSLSEMDNSVFAKWKAADIPVMITAGGLGTLTSVLLRDFFADFHDNKWGKKLTENGGHSGEFIDKVPGNKSPGGFGHRWKYGHDILNPFEVEWDQYVNIAKESGSIIPSWLKAPFYWLRHLFQDTFSKEGLPIPGNTLMRYFMNPSSPKTREVLQILTTIKMRDIAGAGITNAVMGGYLWGTEGDIKRVTVKPNYRAFSLMLGANLITLFSGLLVPPPMTSFNWGTIPIIGYYSYQLFKLEKKIRAELEKRDKILLENDKIIQDNDLILKEMSIMNDEFYKEFLKYEEKIINFYNETINNHNRLKKRILQGGN